MSDQFVSLHGHCKEGSLLDSTQSYRDLINSAKSLGQRAVSLTDHGAINAVFDAYKYSKTQGIKLIAGNEFYFRHSESLDERGNKHIVLIARNRKGWENILRLNYLGWRRQKVIFMKSYPIITWEDLKSNGCSDIIALTACSSGILSRDIINNQEEDLHCHIQALKEIFGDNLFLEVQPHSLRVVDKEGIVKVDQNITNRKLVSLAREYDIKLVATCDAHYTKGDAKIHDMLLAIKDKKSINDETRHRYSVDEFYLKSGNDIVNFFGPTLGVELIKNTQMIAQRCDETTYLDPPKNAYLPTFPVSDAEDYAEFKTWKSNNIKSDLPDDICYLRYKTALGWQKKYEHLDPEHVDECYCRLKNELGVIEEKGFSSYMLMVADFIEEAKKQNNPSGYGRGSAAGSLVSYLTGITKVDPLKHKLLFERFLNKYKTSYPDIDMEFYYPEKIMEYAKKKYGEKRVAQISNIMVMTPKVVVKDVARSLELGSSESDTDEEKKSIAFKVANDVTKSMPDVDSIEEAMKISPEFSNFMRKYPVLYENCIRLQNIERQNGVHAAGIVVSNEDLDQIAPLRCDKTGNLILAYDKDKAEEAGFIKFDFLGLETLGILDDTIKSINLKNNSNLELDSIPTDDQNVFGMISSGDVKGVFQLGLTAAPMCKAIKPRTIDEIAIVTAIIRPSVPVEQRKAYVNKRNGFVKTELLHPSLAETTKETFGEVLYEEQLMTLARDVAGWDLYRADSLRKITKMKDKGKELAEKTKKEFIEDALKVNNISKNIGNEIWEHYIENFTGYGFNCMGAQQLIDTEYGMISIEDVIEKFKLKIKVATFINGDKKYVYPSYGECTGKKEVFKIELENKSIMYSTDDHTYLYNNKWYAIGEMEEIDLYEKKLTSHLKTQKIKSIQSIGIEDVFDIEIPNSHNFILENGAIAHNCSHAVSYSYLSYFTAWCKYYHPTEFMCAMLNSKDPNSDKAQEYIQMAKDLGINVLPPDIDKSSVNYTLVDNKKIRMGMLSIKGIGEDAINYLIEHRPYSSFPEFIMKSTGTKGNRSPITKTVIESLIKVGGLDGLNISRKNALEHWSDIKTKVSAAVKKAAKNNAEIDLSTILDDFVTNDEYDKKQILQYEMEVIGHYLTGDHNDIYGGFFKNSPDLTSLDNINSVPSGRNIKIEAVVKVKIKELKIKSKNSKSYGKAFAKYLLEDINGKTAEITLWPEQYAMFRNILTDGIPLRAVCEVNEYMDSKSLVLKHLEDVPGYIVNGKIIQNTLLNK